MKKLMTFSFTALFLVMAVLSCINFSLDGMERIEFDKQMINIEKPNDISNEEFLAGIDSALGGIGVDIMYRYVDVSDDKLHYTYYRTQHDNNFISAGGKFDNTVLSVSECISTTNPDGYTVYPLSVSSVYQDVTFFSWENAAVHDLTSCSYFVLTSSCDTVASAIMDLGYTVTVQRGVNISGKLPVVLFGFLPICLLVMGMMFYVLSNGKKNVLKKMEGYRAINVLADEMRANGKTFLFILLTIEVINIIVAAIIYPGAILQYINFAANYVLIGIASFIVGVVISIMIIVLQRGSAQIKGKAPKKAMYYITMSIKCVFVTMLAFFMTIGVRNVEFAYNTFSTSRYVAEKVDGYVTIPVYTNNASYHGLEDGYYTFYKATVDEYDGILVYAANYAVDIISGKTPCEEYGQDEITVNTNYLSFNPVYGLNGQAINPDDFTVGTLNILVPESKMNQMEKYKEHARIAYGKEANFIIYDGVTSEIYSYNPETGSGSFGQINQPIIIVVEEDDLGGIEVLSYCTSGSYFIKPHTDDPYAELLPLLRNAGIDTLTLQTPYITSNFAEVVNQQLQMLTLYATQTIVLAIGLACLILFASKLYCENYRVRIACCLIEGYTLFSCIKQHVAVVIIGCLLTLTATFIMGNAMQVAINHNLVIIALIAEMVSAFVICNKYTKAKLFEIVKGAE